MSGRTVIPDSDRQDDEDPLLVEPLRSVRNMFLPESQQYLSKLFPEQSPPSKLIPPVAPRITNSTPGETLQDNNEEESSIPFIKSQPVEFIPLDLARRVVKRMEEDMKRTTSLYKQQLKDMWRTCEEVETAYREKCKELMERGQEVHRSSTRRFSEKNKRLQEQLTLYKIATEELMGQLKEKVRSLDQEKKELMEKLHEESVAPSQDPSDVVELMLASMVLRVEIQDSEPARTLYSLMNQHESLLQQHRTLQTAKTTAKTSLENWTQEFQHVHHHPPKKTDLGPVNHLELDLSTTSTKIQLVQEQMSKLYGDILTLGFALTSEEALVLMTEERDSLQRELNTLKQVHKELQQKFDPRVKFELEQMTADRNGLRRELEELRKELAKPSTQDGPTEVALKSQVDFLGNELTIFKGKSFVLEVENKELHEQLEALRATPKPALTAPRSKGHNAPLLEPDTF